MIEYLVSKYVLVLNKVFKFKYNNNYFNLSDLDLLVDCLSSFINIAFRLKKNHFISQNIGVFASLLYDNGGHTECIKSMIESLREELDISLFLSKNMQSMVKAPVKYEIIKSKCQIFGIDDNMGFTKSVIDLYKLIINANIKCAFVFIHPNDLIFSTVLSLLKKNTKTKIIFYNHASHYPLLGLRFSDLILEGLPVTHYVTNRFRNLNKSYVFGLQSLHKDSTLYLSSMDIMKFRKIMGINEDSYLSMTGCVSYKLFDGDTSEYFMMIKRLLYKIPKLEHVVITKLSDKQNQIVSDIFKDSDLKNRLHFQDFSPNFDSLFQCCDVFIDSFPISSALTHIDLMRNRKPTVVKINSRNSLFSFHEYFPYDYDYMFSEIIPMEEGIFELINNKSEQVRISNILYNHYLLNFEGGLMKEKYMNLINNLDDLSVFYENSSPCNNYNFHIR
jgi:hypothetical protein